MKLQTKLLLLFACVAILPLAILSFYTRYQLTSLSKDLTAVSRAQLTHAAQLGLKDSLEQFTHTVISRRRTVQILLAMQANQLERILRASPDAQVITDADFDRAGAGQISGLHPSDVHTDVSGKPMMISFEHAAVRIPLAAPKLGDTQSPIKKEAAALASSAQTLREIRAHAPDLLYFQYAGMASGVHLTYPGHGGYPREYDPRTRGWYLNAASKTDDVFMPPYVDATTRRVILTFSRKLHDANGAAIGVTAIDVPLSALIQDNRLAHRWGKDAQADIIRIPQKENEPATVIASQQYDESSEQYDESSEHWEKPVALGHLRCDDPAQLERMMQTLRTGKHQNITVSENGRLMVLAAMPIGNTQLAAVIRIPYQDVVAPAILLEQQFLALTNHHTHLAALTIMVLLAAVLVAVVMVSRSLAMRIGYLSQAAQDIASGKLNTRVPERGKDELSELAKAFNAMIPQLKHRLEILHSLDLAKQVQQSLLPSATPTLDGLDIAGCSLYCDQTGGDYYDFISVERLSPQQLVVAVGDVCGHGVAAAMLMATARGLLRSRIEQPGSLAHVFSDMNRHLTTDDSQVRFMTMLCLIIDQEKRQLSWVSAGHDPIIAYEPDTDRFYELAGEDIPMGIDRKWAYSQQQQDNWAKGTVLVAGTDGIWETRNAAGEFFGKDRLNDIIRSHSRETAKVISHAITDAVAKFRGDAPQADDVTLVVMRLMA